MQATLDWRIHIGAHKTATTHLQRTLAHNIADLTAAGVDYIGYPQLRPALARATAPGRFGWRRRVRALTRSRFETRVLAEIDRCRTGRPAVLISDENLLGLPHDLLSARPYPNLWRIGFVRALPAGARVTLFLGIRSFARILPSAYAEALRTAPLTSAMLESLAADLRAHPPSWLELIGRLKAAYPGCGLRLWRHEDYVEDAAPVVSALVGRDIGPLTAVPVPSVTASPGGAAVMQVQAMAETASHGHPPADWERRVGVVFDGPRRPAEGSGARPFQPFDGALVSLLEERYAQDLAEIDRDMPGIRIGDHPAGRGDARRWRVQ